MSRDPSRMVRLAVALLPRSARERYREQWTGELRDAVTMDIPQSEIATGALKFAATTQRPMPRWFRTTSPRFSVALAFSAALVALSEYATLVPVTDGLTFTRTASIASTPLIAWVVIVPLVALVLGLASRSALSRERIVVVLLAVASYLPFLRTPIDSLDTSWTSQWLTLGALTYAVGGLLVAVAAVLAWREYVRPDATPRVARAVRLRRSAIAGLALAALVVACSFDEFARWASREPLLWLQPITDSNRAEHAQWLILKAQAEQMVSQLLTTWVVAGLILALGIVAFGFSRHATLRRTIALAGGVASAALVSYGGLVMFLQVMSLSVVVVVPVAAVELVGRVGMIVVVLVFLGRRDGSVRAAPEVRQDVIAA